MSEPSRCADLVCLDLESAERVRAALPDIARIEGHVAAAKAVADPTRLTLLLALASSSELCVCDLSWIVSRPQNLTSHHLLRLRDAGLVATRREAKVVHYALTDRGREAVAAFAGQVHA